MKIIKPLTIITLLLLSLTSYSQDDFSKSIIIEDFTEKNSYIDTIDVALYNSLKKYKEKSNYVLYHWDQKAHQVTHDPSFGEEKPAKQVVFLKPKGYYNLNPELIIKTDTSGKTTSVYFETYCQANLYGKVIDVATSKIFRIFNYPLIPVKEERTAINVDWKKHFGGDPAKLRKSSPSNYAKLERKVRNEYEGEIRKMYWSKVDKAKSSCRYINNYLAGTDYKYFEVIPQPGLDDKSIKTIEFNGTAKDGIIDGNAYDVLVKRMIEDQHYYERVTTVYVKEVGEQKSSANTAIFKSKDLAAELKNGSKLLLVADDNNLLKNKLNSRKDIEKVAVSLKKECLFCAMEAEQSIAESPVVDLVERNAPELKYFANLLKSEKFIDYSVEDLQGKILGSQILITRDKKFINAIDVKSNKNLISIENSVRFLGMDLSIEKVGYDDLSQILSAFNPELYGIEMVKIQKEKKGKVKEVLVNNPVGFDSYSKFDIVTLEKEEVDGEVYMRNNKVGEGRLGKQYSINLAEMKIKDGEKEIYELLQKKTPIYFVYAK